MYSWHSFLMLCEQDWKLDSLATNDYPSWLAYNSGLLSNAEKSTVKVKDTVSKTVIPLKQPSKTNDSCPKKKMCHSSVQQQIVILSPPSLLACADDNSPCLSSPMSVAMSVDMAICEY